ncbi:MULTISPECIES: hypothetical protein [Arcobacteraceae]|uniref:Uncharacterized protein n=1 Tax=Aliarcobacter butzleri L351 TaxID=1447259 RepID=A0A837J463_9BACT|nr:MULTISPECIES: hypothetical protein [Arcobacteraceae]KLE00371.1 hypothetical protein AF76_07630 [Aliarcobacter butzleri L351]KLE12105.1 hypothetical protein AF75_10255 [Aliarcobacter butzleri L350]MCT7911082.1 hypothetical protein [Arcobacter lacus]
MMVKLKPSFLNLEEYLQKEYPTSLLDYKKIVVQYKNHNIPLFKFCYGKYKSTGKSFFIEEKTYMQTFEIVAKYVFELLIQHIQIGKSLNTFLSFDKRLKQFCSWCFDNGFKIKTTKEASEAYMSYSIYLKGLLRQGKSLRHCMDLQKCVRQVLTRIHDDKQMIITNSASLISLHGEGIPQRRTEPSSLELNAYHLEFYKSIFNQITDFLIEKRPYPFQLKLTNMIYNVLPTQNKFYSIDTEFSSPIGFNHQEGRVYTYDELLKIFPQKSQGIINHHLKYITSLLEESSNPNHKFRYKLGQFAIRAFYILFLTNTGMNGSSAIKLRWHDDYEQSTERQKFIVFKNRANKLVEFEIEKKFHSMFKKYIVLRKYMLQNRTYKYLFFQSYGVNAKLTKTQLDGSWSGFINKYFKKTLDPRLPTLNSKILRINKTDYVVRKHGLIQASNMMQNKVSTILKHYTAQREEVSNKQITDFFSTLNERVFENNNVQVETIIGQCSKTEEVVINNEFPVDCNNKQTCLFCPHYRCHLDKQDLQKIFSLQFILLETRAVAFDEKQFLSVYEGLLKRIDELKELALKTKRISIQDMESIKNEVFYYEKLHPYWEHKFKKLLDMGVLK